MTLDPFLQLYPKVCPHALNSFIINLKIYRWHVIFHFELLCGHKWTNAASIAIKKVFTNFFFMWFEKKNRSALGHQSRYITLVRKKTLLHLLHFNFIGLPPIFFFNCFSWISWILDDDIYLITNLKIGILFWAST